MPAKSKPSQRPKKGKGPQPGGQGWKVLLACLFLAGFVVVCLVFLAQLRPPPPPEEPSPVVAVEGPAAAAVFAIVENVFLKNGIEAARMESVASGPPATMDVQDEMPPISVLAELENRLQGLDKRLVLERPSLNHLLIRDENRRYLLVRFKAPEKLVAPRSTEIRLAIIMDDLGRDLTVIERLLGLDLPITFAILPGEKYAGAAAALVNRHGGEIMIHIPMEPQSYPATNPGRDALFVGMSRSEIQGRFRGFLKRVPHAVGGNNHMGSRFTEDREGMKALLELMKENGMFFVDSRTTGASVAADEARNMRVPVLERDVFLDNQPDVAKISAQVRLLVARAKRRGQAVGICHPYPETIQALREMTGYFSEEGVEVVPISTLFSR